MMADVERILHILRADPTKHGLVVDSTVAEARWIADVLEREARKAEHVRELEEKLTAAENRLAGFQHKIRKFCKALKDAGYTYWQERLEGDV
jgi:ABC-type Fe3+-hydroxamate transport system substrate-binding protein